jgi:hypothetical protein
LHEVSRSEAIAVADLLAGKRHLNQRAGLDPIPRRTRQAIRQRLLSREVIKERYVPDPSLLGRPLVCFAMAQPYADRTASAIEAWRSETSAVNVWAFSTTLFGVFFLPGREECAALESQLGNPEHHQSFSCLVCDSREASVPVYFDSEGAWATITGLPGTVGYPHSLPCSNKGPDESGTLTALKESHAVQALLNYRSADPSRSPSGGWIGRLAIGDGARRTLREGRIEFRTILDPVECLRWASRFPQSIALIRGTQLKTATTVALFRALVGESGVFPFLFASDGSTVLLGSLAGGQGGARKQGRGTSTVQLLGRYLKQIEVRREPIDSLVEVVDHRYNLPVVETPKSRLVR